MAPLGTLPISRLGHSSAQRVVQASGLLPDRPTKERFGQRQRQQWDAARLFIPRQQQQQRSLVVQAQRKVDLKNQVGTYGGVLFLGRYLPVAVTGLRHRRSAVPEAAAGSCMHCCWHLCTRACICLSWPALAISPWLQF
jgi:hypothetical protein